MKKINFNIFLPAILCCAQSCVAAEEPFLMPDDDNQVVLKLPLQTAVSKCNIHISIQDVMDNDDVEIAAPNYETKIKLPPGKYDGAQLKWEGKIKFRGLGTNFACNGSGVFIINIAKLPMTEADIADLQSISSKISSQKYAEAVAIEKRRALKGNSDAQAAFALAYWEGLGVEKNYTESIKWARLSASENINAAYILGYSYVNGFSINKNCDVGLKHINYAASRGLGVAAAALGELYSTGKCTDINYEAARTWYQKGVGD